MMIKMMTMVVHGDKYASITRSHDAPVVSPNNQIPSWNLHTTTNGGAILLIIITSTLLIIVMAEDDDDDMVSPPSTPGTTRYSSGTSRYSPGTKRYSSGTNRYSQVLPLLPISLRLPLPSPPVSKWSRRESLVLIIVIIIVDNVIVIHHLHHHCQPIPVQAIQEIRP